MDRPANCIPRNSAISFSFGTDSTGHIGAMMSRGMCALFLTTAPLALGGVPAAAAQNLQSIPPVTTLETPSPTPTPAPSRSPTIISPPVKFYSVPTPTPSPNLDQPTPPAVQRPTIPAPQPTPTPAPAPAQRTRQPASVPAERRAPPPTTRSAPQPAATPTPATEATPAEPTAAIAVPDITNDTGPTAEPVREGIPQWIWIALAGGVAVVGAGAMLFIRRNRGWRRVARRMRNTVPEAEEQTREPEPPAAPDTSPAPVAPPVRSNAAAEPLQIAIQPLRAGTTQGEGVVEFVITVANPGGVDAEDVVVAAWLRSAHPQQDDEVAQLLHAAPNPYLPKSRIAAGGSKQIQSRLTLPRNRMRVMQASGRPYFIPMIVVDVRYKSGGARQSAAVVMVGRHQESSDKLGPIFLDQPARMHDRVEARSHRVAVPA